METWTEFEEYPVISLLSDVGGSMGLLLGLSIMSTVEAAVKASEFIAGRLCGAKPKRKGKRNHHSRK